MLWRDGQDERGRARSTRPSDAWIGERVTRERKRLRDELRKRSALADAAGGLIAVVVIPLILRNYVRMPVLALWSALFCGNFLFGYAPYIFNLGSDRVRRLTNQIWLASGSLALGLMPWLSLELREDFGASMVVTVVLLAAVASGSVFFPQTINGVWRPFTGAVGVSLGIAHLVAGRWALAAGVVGLFAHLLGGAKSISTLVDQLVGQRVNSEINEEEAKDAALLDSLTGLLSRRGIEARINDLMASNPEVVACAVVDIDDFKQINDLWGHGAGDRTLVAMAEKIRSALPNWHLSRLSGDEFLAVAAGPLTEARQEQLQALVASSSAQNRTSTGPSASCRVSVGATSVSAGQLTISRLFGEASAALNQAKQRGKGQLAVMDEQTLASYENLIRLGGPVADAIRDGEIQPFGQTIVDMRSGEIQGVELLARWLKPDGQIEMPGVFIPVIEHRGLGAALGESMLKAAAQFGAAVRASGSNVYVSVNISASHLAAPDLVPLVSDVLHTHRCPPDALLIEVTESENLGEMRGWQENANRLRKLGVGLAIDDFGTGYSSISQLLELPFSHLKVDRSIVQQVTDGSTRSLLLGLRQFADSAGITLVAEGVELDSERDLLLELGIGTCQGYLFSRPTTLDAVYEDIEQQGLPFGLDEGSIVNPQVSPITK